MTFNYVTPREYLALAGEDCPHSLAELQAMARAEGTCDCGEPVWKLGGCGLCFSCTTGEADPSDDYELIPED